MHTGLRLNYFGKIFNNENEVDNHIYEVCESICNECSAKDEVENDKRYSIVEKADLILKKDMEHAEITRDKENLNIESTV